ncbi:MAG: phosphate--AMP phosphotransferase [Lachnospiraceae bacterium]|nr:phosphate--AMP phosphotransferase [Lachnospiraceae bacterium]
MLEQIDLSKKMSKKDAKVRMEELEAELGRLQRQAKDLNLPVMIVFEGFGAAGKGYQISRLIRALDPRGFSVFSVSKETEEEKMHPFMWRYWTKTPAYGRIAIYDRSWYRKVLIDRFEGITKPKQLVYAYEEINSFEQQLTDGGYTIIKLFLCIDQKEQKKRFDRLLESKSSAWRVTKEDLKRNKHFDEYKQMNDEMLEKTDTDAAPWTLIESMHREFATVKIYTAVISTLQDAIAKRKEELAEKEARKGGPEVVAEAETAETQTAEQGGSMLQDDVLRTSSLHSVDLSLSLTQEEYKKRLEELQAEIAQLHGELYRRRIPVVLGFEGWDAGGKGGAIKRLTEKMDPRGYQVHPTAAPNDIEKVHHYLWRFWRELSKDGHIDVFDRTWYGRVMVERVEGFCSEKDWKRAYQEINDMEKDLYQHGAIVLKFWMQIDKDEQERRFKERMATPDKQWKITDEDWRNREKWDLYEEAVDEMLVRTSTTYAPWIIVEGNNKQYARIKVLQSVVDAIKARLAE